MEDFEQLCQSRRAPATAEVYREVRQRMKHLVQTRDYMRGFAQMKFSVQTFIDSLLGEKDSLDAAFSHMKIEEHDPSKLRRVAHAFRGVMAIHDKLLTREQQIRLFRNAVEKERDGRRNTLTDVERLYLIITQPGTPFTPKERIRNTLHMVIMHKLEDKLEDVSARAAERIENEESRQDDEDVDDAVMQQFVNEVAKKLRPAVDNFTCATSLAELKSVEDVVDDNAGCCPVCQESYIDSTIRTADELVADYPVTIKYCGHTIGKACLEQWLRTPKIDQARYPDRTCPFCRVKIENVTLPRAPLHDYCKHNRRMQETMRELVYTFGMEVEECFNVILAMMSEEIAIEQLAPIVQKDMEPSREGPVADAEWELYERKIRISKMRGLWGLKGNAVWMRLRNEWQAKRANKDMGEGGDIFIDDDDETGDD